VLALWYVPGGGEHCLVTKLILFPIPKDVDLLLFVDGTS